MNIEFHTPKDEVHNWIIKFMRDRLIDLHHKNKSISRAEVYFRDQDGVPGEEKICEIDLAIFGESIFVSRSSDSFEKASRQAIDAVAEKSDAQLKLRNEPPDLITSTVKV